jgi:hypothetical protein
MRSLQPPLVSSSDPVLLPLLLLLSYPNPFSANATPANDTKALYLPLARLNTSPTTPMLTF